MTVTRAAMALLAGLVLVACGSSAGHPGRVHEIPGTVEVTIASPSAWLSTLSSRERAALHQGRPRRPCPPPPGAFATVVDGASIQVRDGGGAMVAVAPLEGSTLTLHGGRATCSLSFTVNLPEDDHFTVNIGAVPPITVDGKKARHDGQQLTIPLAG